MIPPIYGIELCKWDKIEAEKLKVLDYGDVVEKFCNIENCHHRILERIYEEKVLYGNPSDVNQLIYKVWECFNYDMLGKDHEEIKEHETRYNDLIKTIFAKLRADLCPQIRIYDDYWYEGHKKIFNPDSYYFAGNKFTLYYRNPEEDPNIEYKEIASFHMIIDGAVYNHKVYGGEGHDFCILWLDYYKEKDQNGLEWYYRKVTFFHGIDKICEIKQKFDLIDPYPESKMENYNSLLAAYLNVNFRKFKKELSSKLEDASENTKLKVRIEFHNKAPNDSNSIADQLFLKFYIKNGENKSKFSKIPLVYQF